MERGKFISLEGIEGAGKSTAVKGVIRICEELFDRKIIHTREPGGTFLAERFRQILLDDSDEELDHNTELLLFFAGRSQHVSQLIEPALVQGTVVISDRFIDATYAYQGNGRGVSEDDIDSLVRLVHPDLKPDITFLLDAPLSVCLDRIRGRTNKDRFEKENRQFFERVREGYLKRASAEPDRIIVINSNQPKENVLKSIRVEIQRLF